MDIDVKVEDERTFILTEANILRALRLSRHRYKLSSVIYNKDKILIKVSKVDGYNRLIKLVEYKTPDKSLE